MCAVCGCSDHGPADAREVGPEAGSEPGLVNFDAGSGVLHFGAGAARVSVPGMSHQRTIQLEADILGANDRVARQNRAHFQAHGVTALNLVAGPGAGKTTLLCATIEALRSRDPRLSVAVIEGDQQTSFDADRIRATGAPAIQINTGKGCHLDAPMVAEAFARLHGPGHDPHHDHGHPHHPDTPDLLFIENVGNLVCPALWDLGEAAKVAILSVTEGEDKPLKYPDLFAASQLLVLNKIDLLPYVRFDVARCIELARRVNSDIEVLLLSAATGEGLDAWLHWLELASGRTPRGRAATSASVLGVGAWLKNTACLVLRGQAHWSALHGDLSDPSACAALDASVQALLRQADAAGAPVQAIAHDLHPDFFSSRLAVATADALGVPAIGVQHHHAHLGAVLSEHGLQGPVVGLALDGVGLGSDGTAWGGELLWLDGANWARLGHLQPLALPGGDRAAREPWRMAASALHALGRADEIVPRWGRVVGETVAAGVRQMLDRGLNCPPTSSAGRWFDAAVGALGLCHYQHDEAQAARLLEQAAARALGAQPGLPPLAGAVLHDDGRIDLRLVLARLFDATDADAAAAGFHLALIDALCNALIHAAQARGTRIATLSGGCFFNRILRDGVVQRLQAAGLHVYEAGPKGCGDAGLAIGQAWVAARRLEGLPARRQAEEAVPCA